MNYKEAVSYLYDRLPMFQRVGQQAYKEGLQNTIALDNHFAHPHRSYRTIHVGGTNGKGSVSHTIASVLQSAGYRVGLYTSPHLVNFTERIRVNGAEMEQTFVTEFVSDHKDYFESLSPSFFEVTTLMAFHYFRHKKVDVAIIEVGLGGRLDCTNIIEPDLSIITNIGLDHMALLGDTLPKIATEKAGIVKSCCATVIGQTLEDTRPVFECKAKEVGARLFFADQPSSTLQFTAARDTAGRWVYQTDCFGKIIGVLKGECQWQNGRTVLFALNELRSLGYHLESQNVADGFLRVSTQTGLRGRWELLGDEPGVICDTGHNEDGIRQIVSQLATERYDRLRIVFGVVSDKEVTKILSLMPQEAVYYFAAASVPRSMPAEELFAVAASFGLQGNLYASVAEAFDVAKKESAPADLIFIGGSTFVVSDLLRDCF